MNKIVLDASALLALLNQERGYQVVEHYLPHSIMSTVNVSEVIAVLIDIHIPQKDAETLILNLIKEILVFDQQQAVLAACLRKKTKTQGLSLGDRACIALAQLHRLPVLTADKAWSKINEVEVELIR